MVVDDLTHGVLSDGTRVRIRPLQPADIDQLHVLLDQCSDATNVTALQPIVEVSVTSVSRPGLRAIVATAADSQAERIVGAAACRRDVQDPTAAAFAVVVAPGARRRGLGTALVRTVAQAAFEEGVRRLTGDVTADNEAMLGVIEDVGLDVAQVRERDIVHAALDLVPTETYLAAVAQSEKSAAVAALTCFLRPERVAVVGASRSPDAIGGLVFANLLAGGFRGVVYPVNPSTHAVQGVAAYPSLTDCPAVPDLAVVCVPGRHVLDVVDEAGRLGIKSVCVISAGFAETGPEGRAAQAQLLERARAHGVRIVGPNCMGVLNGAANVRMNATFSRILPEPGRLSFVSQSGALGLSVLEHLDERRLGISAFVSVGNKADISGNDLLLYWEDDPETDAILLYLESFGNPRRFSRIARRVSKSKPIIAVKAGRTAAGQRAASSHTAALASGDRPVEALFRQTGVIRTDTLEQMFSIASLASTQPAPPGRRVAIVTNGGGPGILAADACEAHGLHVAPLSEATQAKLRDILPAAAGTSNPVDMIASSTAEHYRATAAVVGNAPEIDAVIAIFIPPIVTRADHVARALAEARRDIPAEKPMLGVFMGVEQVLEPLADANIPSFTFPEDAAYSLGALAGWSEWSRRPSGHVVRPDGVDIKRARAVVDEVLEGSSPGERRWLDTDQAHMLLEAFAIPRARSIEVASAEEAAEAFEGLGSEQVAVKIASAIHKADVGGVKLGVRSAIEARLAVEQMRARLESAGLEEHARHFLVQELVTDGVEMVVGVTHDPLFGPLLMVGCGGTLVELIEDVNLRITPVTDLDVDEMLTTLRTYPLLTGYRGAPPVDLAAIKEVLYRVNQLVEAVPELVEMDLNPVFARPKGTVTTDVRIALQRAT